MRTKYLVLWIEAPLQSWGADSKFYNRGTEKFPTKSGIAGLLLNAMGARGSQEELLSHIADSELTVISFRGSDKEVSATLSDFHMVGSGYDDSDPWESLFIPKKSDGNKAACGPKLTYRFYLQNAKFAVILKVPEYLSEKFSNALKMPLQALYLGRKCCAPTDIIYRGEYNTQEEAESAILEISKDKSLVENFRVLDEKGSEKGDTYILNDVPVSFGSIKRYRDRYITVIRK